MFDILVKFIALPFIGAFILGFLYYSLWKVIHPKIKQKSETAS